MILKIFIQLFFFAIIFAKTFSLIIYLQCQLFYVDDYIDYIISSEGSFTPLNPSHTFITRRNGDYTFNFTIIKHNFTKPLCYQIINMLKDGFFAFKYATINEYEITKINYENYYYYDNCNTNTPKKFKTTSKIYSNGSPQIYTSYYEDNKEKRRENTFCLNPINDISIFYVDESKINQKYYMGKNIEYILNNEFDFFNINNIFVINGNEDFFFDLNSVSFKIINITNKKGKIFNDKEELFEGSFFNSKNENLTHEKINDDGYLMVIYIVTKPRNQKLININTCEKEAKIYLYVAQNNCTMNETSNNYCQQCIPDYGKNIIENKCYHKSEKYENSNQISNNCEINNNNCICSICPKGTYIKDNFSQICEKCKKGEYSNKEDNINCEKCPEGYFSNKIGASMCEKCPEGYTSSVGSDKCYKDCEPGYYSNGDICIPCKPGYYSQSSSTTCLECIPGTYTNKEGMEKCLKCEPGTFNNIYKAITCIDCPVGYYSSLSGSTECIKCPLGTFNSIIGNNNCEKCDFGYYNDQLGANYCKLCQPNFYSDKEGSTFCKECEINKYSLFGFNKCLSCEETILHCTNCSKQGLCLNCNNNALSGFNNCSICENEIDWKYTGEYCQLLTKCENYYYKDKNNNNKIICIKNINECPEGMNYLNLETKECKEKVKPEDFINYQYK